MKTPYQSIVLIGKTGCGKGTQAALLAEKFGYQVFSTGNEVRKIGSQPTPLGRRINEIQVAGWVPEWLASYLMTKAVLESGETGLVFESVARKLVEAEKLNEMHEMLERSYVVIHLDIDDETATERMLARNRDASDQTENIVKRLASFHNETKYSLEFFSEKGKVQRVDADQPLEKVFDDIIKLLQSE